MSERGFIALARGVLDHPIVGARKPYSRHDAWEWLLFEAAFKPRRYAAGSIVVTLDRGQLAHSTRYMADAWGWSEAAVRRFLTRLKTGAGTGAMIDAQTDAGITVITICNYERYQSWEDQTDAATDARTDAPTDAEATQQRRRKEQLNNETIDNLVQIGDLNARKSEPKRQPKEGDPLFVEFYSAYPRRQSKQDAIKAYAQVRKTGVSHEAIMSGLERAKRSDRRFREMQFTPLPASWLRAGGFEDEAVSTQQDWKQAVFS